MHTFIERGTRIVTEIGTDKQPEIVRWTTWGKGIQQSYALISPEGTVLINPVRPGRAGAVSAFEKYSDGKYIAVVCTTPMHERNVYWFRENYNAPIYAPKDGAASEFKGKLDYLYEDGDVLPGGVKALGIEDDVLGEMILLWQSQGGMRMLICGDAINGQSVPGGFEGVVEAYWLQVGGIRLRMQGRVDEDEMKRRFERLLNLDFDIILNGHNPKPIDQDPKGALLKVLREGTYEIHPRGVCTYIWIDLLD